MPTNNADQITTTTPDERKELMLDIMYLLERMNAKSLRKARALVAWIFNNNI